MNIARLLTETLENLRRNRAAVMAYMAAVAAMSLVFRIGGFFLGDYSGEDAVPAGVYAVSLVMDLTLASLYAALQAVAFSAMGREIDRPLWKCAGAAEALRRFFLPWFIINLGILALARIQLRAAMLDMPDLVILLELCLMMAYCLAVPIGACIMFYGALEWREMGSILAPIARRFGVVWVVLLINFGQFVVSRAAALSGAPPALEIIPARTLLDAALAMVDCFVFAAIWMVCQIHRNEAPTTDNDDFAC